MKMKVNNAVFLGPTPVRWNPFNKVVQDHKDGTVDEGATNAVRSSLGLPVPWTPEIGKRECRDGDPVYLFPGD